MATELFLADGYGETTIELIARRAGISKRTFYDRFADKAAVFKAVVRRVVERLRPPDVAGLFVGGSLEEILTRLGQAILHAALQPRALALHRVLVAESGRFPELAAVSTDRSPSQEAVQRIAALLIGQSGKRAGGAQAEFAASQFLQMTIALPQRRALGLGTPMTRTELDSWTSHTVGLFLQGWYGPRGRSKKRRAASTAR